MNMYMRIGVKRNRGDSMISLPERERVDGTRHGTLLPETRGPCSLLLAFGVMMETLDPAGEWLRLSEHYRLLSDDELLSLARQPSELTDIAQQALAQEISQRGLKPQPQSEAAPAPQKPEPTPDSSDAADSPYAEDRKLVEICTVWSLADALQVQRLLDRAGIPFFMGPQKATEVDAATLNFGNGVSVQVMQIAVPSVRHALQHYKPADEPPEVKAEEELGELAIHCPKCHSTEVVFEGLVSEPATATDNSPSKFKWTCGSCGHEWEDEGVETDE
jgi:DNA-directed RNA polymerase subunit M/transcription elongation factor TFIIS